MIGEDDQVIMKGVKKQENLSLFETLKNNEERFEGMISRILKQREENFPQEVIMDDKEEYRADDDASPFIPKNTTGAIEIYQVKKNFNKF